MIVIGVDPGVGGAVAVLENRDRMIDVFDIPTLPLPNGKKEVDVPELARRLTHYKTGTPVVIERVGAMPQQGVTSTFNFGVAVGAINASVDLCGLPRHLVAPAVWKRRAGLIRAGKGASRGLAARLWPDARPSLARVKDTDRADALLIARFGWEWLA